MWGPYQKNMPPSTCECVCCRHQVYSPNLPICDYDLDAVFHGQFLDYPGSPGSIASGTSEPDEYYSTPLNLVSLTALSLVVYLPFHHFCLQQ